MNWRRFFAPLRSHRLAGLGTQRIIAIGFTLTLLLMVLLTTLGLLYMAQIKSRMATLVSDSSVKVESVFHMRTLARERFASLGQMVVLDDPFERDEEYQRFLAQASKFIQARDRMLALGLSAEEQAAMAMLLGEVRPVEKALTEAFNAMVEQHRTANQASLAAAEADYREARAYMLGMAGLALLIGLFIARVVIRRSRHAESELSRQTEVAVAAAEQLSWAASHDGLTGLANRRELERRLNELVQDTAVNGSRHFLLYIDLDRFKAVNDSCGHFAGDALLCQLAEIFTRHVRSGDLVARVGGDEFCIGLVNSQLEKARAIAEAIRDAVEQFRFAWDGRLFQVGTSIGLVRIAPGMDLARALNAADIACYRAKEQGRNQVCEYSAEA